MEKSHAQDFFMGPVWIFGYVGLLTVKNEFVLTGIRKVILFA
jgi:hypothetical protein